MAICVMYSFYNGLRKCDGFCVFFVVFFFLKASPVWECLLIIYYLANIT